MIPINPKEPQFAPVPVETAPVPQSIPGAILTPEAREANERLQRKLVRKMQDAKS